MHFFWIIRLVNVGKLYKLGQSYFRGEPYKMLFVECIEVQSKIGNVSSENEPDLNYARNSGLC